MFVIYLFRGWGFSNLTFFSLYAFLCTHAQWIIGAGGHGHDAGAAGEADEGGRGHFAVLKVPIYFFSCVFFSLIYILTWLVGHGYVHPLGGGRANVSLIAHGRGL